MSLRPRLLDLLKVRPRLRKLVEIVLRVPPLFVMDEILKLGIVIDEFEYDLSGVNSEGVQGLDKDGILADANKFDYLGNNTRLSSPEDWLFYKFVFISLIRLLISALGCGAAASIFALNSNQLIIVYMYLTSVGVVFGSYWMNVFTLKLYESEDIAWNILNSITSLKIGDFFHEDGLYFPLIQNTIVQALFAFIFVNVHLGPRYNALQKILPLAFFAPMIFLLILSPSQVLGANFLSHAPVFSALLPLALIKFVLWSSMIGIIQTVYGGYQFARNIVHTFGMSSLVESEWRRLSIPKVLRTFWILRVLAHTLSFFMAGYWHEANDGYNPHFRLLKYLMITGCDTVAAVLGITAFVSFVSNYIGKLFQWILLTDDDNDKNIGTVSAVVFYILALQTGLTGLEPEARFFRLCRNFCLLFTALLHFIHNVVNPLLMSLSASHNPSLKRHIHALLVCLVLVLLPTFLMIYLWSTQETSTFLLAVTSFCIEVIVKVFVSLAIYSLFLLDARRETFWEGLDDYIYYIRAFGNSVEFCFGIFLFFNGVWILLFESGGAIRAVMMCIHAYFNIWCDAKAGWSVFIKRRTAVNKIESLPEADEEQLRALDDVCAICYQEMKTAKITRCRHFFHGVCLRKWLYVQDRCPLCHDILHGVDSDNKDATEHINNENNR